MKLVRIMDNEQHLIAEFKNDKVTFLHPTIQRVIDTQKCVVLPALTKYAKEFGGFTVPPNHKKFARAVKIYLEFEIIPRAPELFMWIHKNNQ